MSQFEHRECKEIEVRIFIAGDINQANAICAEACMTGLCVSITETDYVYTMGRERGVIVTLINYARFPTDPESLFDTALRLGEALCLGMHQGSFTAMGCGRSVWRSRRGDA